MTTQSSDGFAVEIGDGFDWLQKNGFPTFDEFRKNPDKYRSRPEEIFEWVDGGDVYFKERLKTINIWWRDKYKCESLERVHRLCILEGYQPNEIEAETIVRSVGGTGKDERFEIDTRFWPRFEFQLRGGIVANE